jgi:adenosine deaminase
MTHEYLRAVESYHLSYAELKRMTRQSLEHSFLSGQSLWADTKGVFKPVFACTSDVLGTNKPSERCRTFLGANQRAGEQWTLEVGFAAFEKKY